MPDIRRRKEYALLCQVCNNREARIDGKYCSFRCKSQDKPKKKERVKSRKATSGSRERKARIRLMAKDYPKEAWKSCVEAWEGKCAYCGKTGRMQQEHFLPVEMGGTYTRDNIIPACSSCNSRKHKKHPLEWLMEKPGGLAIYVNIWAYLSNYLPVGIPGSRDWYIQNQNTQAVS